MRRSRRAAAPGAPTPPRAPHPGYGSCRGMESSGPPPTHPRTFPHPSEILGARPPPAQDSRSSYAELHIRADIASGMLSAARYAIA
jgi:hypothetical protein